MREMILIFNFLMFLYFWERERERQTDRVSRGGAEREGETQNSKQAPGSMLSAKRPKRGSNSQTVRSWPEPKSDTQPTEPPRHPYFICFLKFVCLFIYLKREAEREGERIPSRLFTVSTEPDVGLELINYENVAWAKSSRHSTEPPRRPYF